MWKEVEIPNSFPSNAPLLALKEIVSDLTGVPPEKQIIVVPAWPGISDSVLLRALGLKPRQRVVVSGPEEGPLRLLVEEPRERVLHQASQPSPARARPTEGAARSGGEAAVAAAAAAAASGAGGATGTALPLEQLLGILGQLTPNAGFLPKFESMYGPTHVRFFAGPPGEAMQEAARLGRMLLVYLLHPTHEATVPFCANVLCSPALCEFAAEALVVWVGSLDPEDSCLPPTQAQEISPELISLRLGVQEHPLLAVAGRLPGQRAPALLEVMQGARFTDSDEVLQRLFQLQETYGALLLQQAEAERQVAQARRLVDEQDRAYAESLQRDREREREERRQEEARRQEEERLRREQEERECQERLRREELEARARALPPEPAPTDPAGVALVAVRMPDGSRLQRRFRRAEPLQLLFDWLGGSGHAALPATPFSLVSSFPRREFRPDTPEAAQTLEQVGLVPQAMLYLQPTAPS